MATTRRKQYSRCSVVEQLIPNKNQPRSEDGFNLTTWAKMDAARVISPDLIAATPALMISSSVTNFSESVEADTYQF
jgi:hypothetical protein